MNHLYAFTNSAPAWSAMSIDLSTKEGRAALAVRCGAKRLQGDFTASDLRYLQSAFGRAADELEMTARDQNEAWLDRQAA